MGSGFTGSLSDGTSYQFYSLETYRDSAVLPADDVDCGTTEAVVTEA
jgi:hypothetical protein